MWSLWPRGYSSQSLARHWVWGHTTVAGTTKRLGEGILFWPDMGKSVVLDEVHCSLHNFITIDLNTWNLFVISQISIICEWDWAIAPCFCVMMWVVGTSCNCKTYQLNDLGHFLGLKLSLDTSLSTEKTSARTLTHWSVTQMRQSVSLVSWSSVCKVGSIWLTKVTR
jgi:hypothetical protein